MPCRPTCHPHQILPRPLRLWAGALMPVLALLAALAGPLAAQQTGTALPQPVSDTVTDLAGLLTPDELARLDTTLRAARDETGVHVVVVAMDNIARHGGEGARIEDYAKTLFNSWGIGDATRNDGILILLAKGDRAVRVALGAGYDPIWDGAAQRAIDTAMLPPLRDGNPAGALQAGAEAVIDRIARPHSAGQELPADTGRDGLPGWLVPVAMVAGFAVLAFRNLIGDGLALLRRCPSCGHRGLHRDRVTTIPPVGEVPPGESSAPDAVPERVTTTRCTACGWRREDRRKITPRKAGSRGGRGFGGGRSSGGGATGRW